MPFKIGQLLLTSNQKSSKFCEIYVAQPNLEKEKIAGIIFVLLEIENKSPNLIKFVDMLINSFNRYYYENEKLLLREKVATIKIEHIFETAISKINKTLSEFFENDKQFIDLTDVNATLGVMHENSLHFATIGRNKAYLLHLDKTKREDNIRKKFDKNDDIKKDRYKFTNILGKDDSLNIASVDKFFPNIISGSIPIGSYIIFSGETLYEYLTNKQLIEIITKLPPGSAVEQIKNLLSGINAQIPFLAIIIKNTAPSMEDTAKRKLPMVRVPAHAGESIVNLNSTEENTEKLLSPSGIINFHKWINKLFSSRLINKNQNILIIKNKIFYNKYSLWLPLKIIYSIYSYFKKILLYIIAIIYYLIKYLTKKENWKSIIIWLVNIPNKTANALIISFLWLRNLQLKYKIMIMIILVSSGLFIYNLSATSNKKQTVENKQKIDNLTVTIEQKQNAIDADLLYNNKEGAKKAIGELEQMLSELPNATIEEQDKRKVFYEKFYLQLEKVNQTINISNFSEVADLSKIEATAKPDSLINSGDGNKIFAGDNSLHKIYLANIAEKSVTDVKSDAGQLSSLYFPTNTVENGNIYFYGRDKIIKLETKLDSVSDISFSASIDPDNAIAAAGYNNKIYIANKLSNQILVYVKNGGKYSLSQEWLKDETDIKRTISMGIDGNLYLLQNNGNILKFSKGKKVEFNQEAITPAATSPGKIIASPDMDSIYISDPSTKRIITYDKNGKLLAQYRLNGLDELKDFSINEKNKTVYVLSGTKIFSFEQKSLN
jgi:hypothetical protein